MEKKHLRINKAFERIMGVTAEEVVGRNMADLVAEGSSHVPEPCWPCKGVSGSPYRCSPKSAKRLCNQHPIFDDQSNIVLVVTNVRDMTELMELERRLEHAEDRRQGNWRLCLNPL